MFYYFINHKLLIILNGFNSFTVQLPMLTLIFMFLVIFSLKINVSGIKHSLNMIFFYVFFMNYMGSFCRIIKCRQLL